MKRKLGQLLRAGSALALLWSGLTVQSAAPVAHADASSGNLAPMSGDTLSTQGSRVVHSPTAYLIYWKQVDLSGLGQTFYYEATRCYGPGCLAYYGTDYNYENRTGNFFKDVSGSPWFGTLSQYWDTNAAGQPVPVFDEVTLGGTWADNSNYPNEGRGVPAASLQPSDIQAEVQKAVQQNGWNVTPDSIFFLYLPEEVRACSEGTCTQTTVNGDTCGFHGSMDIDGQSVAYAVIPSPGDTAGCDATVTSPSNDLMVDNAINAEAHELAEAVVDPKPTTGWTDMAANSTADGGEVGDKCHTSFPGRGQVLADGGNVTLNGTDYILQALWSDLDGRCSIGRVPTAYLDPLGLQSLQVENSDVPIEVTGHNFMPESVVQWNGTPLQTHYINTQVLDVLIPASDLANPGVASITVNQQFTEGGVSAARFMYVTATSATIANEVDGVLGDGGTLTLAPGLTVTAHGGPGQVAIAQFNGNPAGGLTGGNTNSFFDIYATPGAFTSLTIMDCALNGGSQVQWFDPAAGWKPASSQTFAVANRCSTVSVDGTTTPSLSQLQGTVVGSWTRAQGYVAASVDGTLVPTADDGTLGTPIQVGHRPDALVLSRDGTMAYVANSADNTVDQVALLTGTIAHTFAVGHFPSALAIAPDGQTVYTANQMDNTVSAINTSSGSVTSIPVGSTPEGLAVSADGSTLYVANRGSNSLSVIATATNQAQSSTIPAGPGPIFVALTADGRTAYVSDFDSNQVLPISLPSGTSGMPIPVGNAPWGIALTSDGNMALVANFSDNTVTPVTLSAGNPTPGTAIPVGENPSLIAITPDGSLAEVTDGAAGAVTPIQLNGLLAGQAFTVGSGANSNPTGIAFVKPVTQAPAPPQARPVQVAPAPTPTPTTIGSGGVAQAPTPTAYVQAVLNDAPAGFWRLDGTTPGLVIDSTGHGLDGQTNGGVAFGKPGATNDGDTATGFDGQSAYVSLGDSSALQPAKVSVEAWINTTSTPGQFNIVVRKRLYGYVLYLDQQGMPVFGTNDQNAVGYYAQGVASVADGRWHHLVGTYDGGQVCLYVDTRLAGACVSAATIFYQPDQVAIGRDGGAADGYFTGQIADVAIYPTALSAHQVGAHYTAAGAPAPTPASAYAQTVLKDAPVGYWRLDNSSPGTIVDASGHGLNGQANGGVSLGKVGATHDGDSAISFDGNTGYISLGDPSSLQGSRVSVEAWVNTTSSPGAYNVIVRKRLYGYVLYLNQQGIPVFGINDQNAVTYSAQAGASVADGKWHQVVGMYDGAQVCLYVDGKQAGGCAKAPPISYQRDLVAIGRDGGAPDGYFTGAIDDVSIYSVALSSQQVAAHYAAANQ